MPHLAPLSYCRLTSSWARPDLGEEQDLTQKKIRVVIIALDGTYKLLNTDHVMICKLTEDILLTARDQKVVRLIVGLIIGSREERTQQNGLDRGTGRRWGMLGNKIIWFWALLALYSSYTDMGLANPKFRIVLT